MANRAHNRFQFRALREGVEVRRRRGGSGNRNQTVNVVVVPYLEGTQWDMATIAAEIDKMRPMPTGRAA